jgi:pyridoxine kinase
MARVLAISSQVVRGHIGLAAVVPALQRLGHDVWPLPTIVLSNHPGHVHASGVRLDPAALDKMIDALDANGWLGEVDAVLSGYLPTPEHVHGVARLVRRLKSRAPTYFLCDPVLGDHPKGIYLDPHAATALRNDLLPLADIATPNQFELGWLTGQPTATVNDCAHAASSLACADVVVTSAARQAGHLLNLHVGPHGVAACSVAAVDEAPHGTGDLFAGLVLGHQLAGVPATAAMARAARGVALTLAASAGRDELVLVPLLDEIAAAPPLRIDPL